MRCLTGLYVVKHVFGYVVEEQDFSYFNLRDQFFFELDLFSNPILEGGGGGGILLANL
jgi:hypothetical protein